MPDLKELLKERNAKKFTKKSYRPWDLSGKDSSSLEESNTLGHINVHTDDKKNVAYPSAQEEVDRILPEEISTKDNNKVSNRYLSDNTIDIDEIPNRYHLDNSIDSNKKSIRYSLDINLDNNEIATLANESEKKAKLLPHKLSIENQNIPDLTMQNVVDDSLIPLEQEIISLSGKQKIIFDIVIDICSARNSLSTGPVQTASLASIAQTTTGTIKTMLIRLIQKQLLIRYPGKNAKGGYVNLGITSTILDLVNSLKTSNKHNIFASDIILSNRYQKDISQEHISSSNYNIITTNLNRRLDQIPPEWENINFEPLSHIGFSKTQIKQMIGKNDPTIVQESINHFAFGLEHNPKVKKYEDPLNVLMGVLRKGQAWVETDYRSAIEIAQQKLLDAKRAEMERKKSLEEEAYKLALSEWDSGITEQEREKITERTNGDLTPPAAKLSKYFREYIWPEKRSEYLLF
ncbi:hypothetical protein [Fluoribacter gormanii]|uniref:hypothetical protein n=1 Tax=Fluoribacter gormanii TaxID=464 RepID=UPI0010413EB4|nr:hypothetical protein [Fluoribacter gormanii]